ncbi:hypothetical protein D9613_009169 [Agrocybe pediades]|uniref:Integrase catalytic domain-containing protein n=1 Tax=Agrocybe pediades TaxID=84607 RepID=A0A8H4VTV6_9AGAR|nr:hypothetical protein D9613_009169 [Agrocybe pediades]
MQALGSGDVSFRYTYNNYTVDFTLRNCLYAPSVPIGLLSVGAFLEKNIDVHFFAKKPITTLTFLDDHPLLPGYVMTAHQHDRLSFMRLDFIRPSAPGSVSSLPSVSAPIALPAVLVGQTTFPRLRLTPELWHRRFGHLGQDATCALLMKNFATGLDFVGSFSYGNCVSCIIGRAPQRPYAHPGNRASRIGELLHMDACGPFAVFSFNGDNMFLIILDDSSNWAFFLSMSKKTAVFEFVKRIVAFITRKTGNPVLGFRVDNALEFIKGALGIWFASQGITDMERGLAWDDVLSVKSSSTDTFSSHCHFATAMLAGVKSTRVFDLTKAPNSYAEAIAHPDSASWIAAMGREMESLGPSGMHAFEEADLPPGEHTVGLY